MSLGASVYRVGDRPGVCQWAEQNIDYSRVLSYDTFYKFKYSSSLFPFWREPMEMAVAPWVKEIAIKKCTRAACSENCIFTPIRYIVAEHPQPILYVGDQESKVATMHRERIVKGFQLSAVTQEKLENAITDIENYISFQDCTVESAHSEKRSIAKSTGYWLICADEVSTYRNFKIQMLRERIAFYPNSRIIWVSSIDPEQNQPSKDDPIVILFKAFDQRLFMMEDKYGGKRFHFKRNEREESWGLKWDQNARRLDGSWDLDRVRATAYFRTPAGYDMAEHEKRGFLDTGTWVPQNPDAPKGYLSYDLPRLYLPTEHGHFGEVAVKWLMACQEGAHAIRAYKYELDAEEYYAGKTITEDTWMDAHKSEYARGECISKSDAYKEFYIKRPTIVIGSVDIQQEDRKDPLWYMFHEWIKPGDGGVIEFDYTADWEKIALLRAKYKTGKMFIDNSYEERYKEVIDQILFGCMKRAVPTLGRDSLKHVLWKLNEDWDPYEGLPMQGQYKMSQVTFNPNRLGHILFALLNGIDQMHKWHVYREGDEALSKHVEAMELIDNIYTRKRKANEGWDCLQMSLLGANMFGYFSMAVTPPIPQDTDQEQKSATPEKDDDAKKPPINAAAPPYIDPNLVKL